MVGAGQWEVRVKSKGEVLEWEGRVCGVAGR